MELSKSEFRALVIFTLLISILSIALVTLAPLAGMFLVFMFVGSALVLLTIVALMRWYDNH